MTTAIALDFSAVIDADGRFARLAHALGLADADHARGRYEHVLMSIAIGGAGAVDVRVIERHLGALAPACLVEIGIMTRDGDMLMPTTPQLAPKKAPKPKKALECKAHEMEAIQRVLAKLAEVTKEPYGGALEHQRLVLNRMRDGVHELELRAIIAFVADEWESKPELASYLRPETLFGPRGIHRYLPKARARYAKELAPINAQMGIGQ